MLLNITEVIFRDEMSQHWQVRQLCGAIWQHSMLISSFIYLFMDCFLLHIYYIHTIYCICTALTLVLFRMWMFSVLFETSAVSVLVFFSFFSVTTDIFLNEQNLHTFKQVRARKAIICDLCNSCYPCMAQSWYCSGGANGWSSWAKFTTEIEDCFLMNTFFCFLTLTDPWFHCARAG